MKKIILLLFTLQSCFLFAQQEIRLDWYDDAYTTSQDHLAVDVVTDGNDNIYSLGKRHNGTDWDFILTKYDQQGNQLWRKIYDSGGTDEGSKLLIDQFATLYVLAEASTSVGDNKYKVVKFNSAGTELWTATGTSGIAGIIARDMAIDGSGNVYVTGTRPNNSTQYDMFVEKISSSGTNQWIYTDNISGYKDGGMAVTVDGSGDPYFTGYYSLSSGETNWMTMKISSSGIQQWSRWYNGADNNSDTATAIAVDGTGNVYVAGKAENSNNNGEYLDFEKLNSSGIVQWVERTNQLLADYPIIKFDDANSLLYVAGARKGTTNNNKALLYQYSASGNLNWLREARGYTNLNATGRQINFPKEILIDNDSSLVYFGYAGSCNSGNLTQYGQGTVLEKLDRSTGSFIESVWYDRFHHYMGNNNNPSFPEDAPAEAFAFLGNKDEIVAVASHPDQSNYTHDLRTLKTKLFEPVVIGHLPGYQSSVQSTTIYLCTDDSIQLQPDNIPSGSTVKWISTNPTNEDWETQHFSDRTNPNAWFNPPQDEISRPYKLKVYLPSGDSTYSTEVNINRNILNTTITAHGPTSFCNGDSVWLQLGETEMAKQIFWFSTASPFSGTTNDSLLAKHTGYYWAEITHNVTGCSITTDSIYISANGPVASLGPDQTVCSDNAPLTLDAGSGYSSYNWSTGASSQTISVSSSGQYSVEVTDGAGCTDQDTVSITVNTSPTVNLGPDQSVCPYETVTLDAGTGYSSYSWNTGASTQSITVSSGGSYDVTVTASNGCTATDQVDVNHFQDVSVNVFTTDETCGSSDGSAVASLTTGKSPATHTWSTGATGGSISNLSAGSYEVYTIDDNGCKDTTSFMINNAGGPTLDSSKTNVTCAGGSDGSASVTVLSGTPTYSYLWNTGDTTSSINNVPAGTYTITVTDGNNCQTTKSFDITELNPLPSVSISGSLEYCAGDSTQLDAGSGFPAYNWSNGDNSQTIHARSAGQYNVTVTDNNGCQNADTVSISENPLPSVNINGSLDYCAGDSTQLDAGGGFSAYNWSTGDNAQTVYANTPGQYSVTVSDNNGCQNADSVSITENPLPSVNLGEDTTICQSSPLTLDAGSGYSNYLWSDGSGTQTISVDSTDTYHVTVNDNNGCSGSDTITVTATICTRIDDNRNNSSFIQIYPNPSTRIFNVESDYLEIRSISIFNSQGKLIMAKIKTTANGKYIDLKSQENGLYFVKVELEDRKMAIYRIIKQ